MKRRKSLHTSAVSSAGISRFSTRASVVTTLVLILLAVRALHLLHSYFVLPSGHDSLYHWEASNKVAYALLENPRLLPEILQENPVRYPPLTYFVFTFVNFLSGHSFMVFAATILLLWTATLACMAALGWTMMPKRWPMILPAATLIATPTFWVVGVSYNLETCLLMGASILLLLFLNSEKLNRWFLLAIACLVAFACAMSKTVVLLAALPAALIMCIDRDQTIAFRRMLLLASMGLSVLLWMILHNFELIGEIKQDYINVPTQGSFYYPWLLLIGYRGAILLGALVVVLILRLARWRLDRTDLAFACWLIVPFIFFSALDTKREWYLLCAYLVVPIWFLYGAGQLWENRPIRILTFGLSALYLSLAFGNTASVQVDMHFGKHRHDKLFAGIPGDFPRIQEAEIFIAEKIVERIRKEPTATFAVDLSGLFLAEEKIMPLLFIKEPRLTLVRPLVMTDRYCNKRMEFLEALNHSTYVLTINEGWLTFEGDARQEPNCIVLPNKEIEERSRSLRAKYILSESIPMIDDYFSPLTIFKNLQPEHTYIGQEFIESGSNDVNWTKPEDYTRYGKTALRQGEWEKALKIYWLLQNSYKKRDGAPGMAQALVGLGDTASFELQLFSILRGNDDYAKQALRKKLSILEKRGELNEDMQKIYQKYTGP